LNSLIFLEAKQQKPFKNGLPAIRSNAILQTLQIIAAMA